MVWHTTPMIAFDVETTGPDPETARIVTACVAHVTPPHQPGNIYQWLVDPGVEIPAEATSVHGVTTRHARKHGMPAPKAVEEITALLAANMSTGIPLVGMNAVYDLTVLDRECRRHGVPTLEDRTGQIRPVIDPLIIDKRVDRYRRGGRKLVDLCATYGVELPEGGAHNATVDAVAAAYVAWAIGARTQLDRRELTRMYADRRYPGELAAGFHQLGALSLAELHQAQVTWRAEQVASLAEWRRDRGEPLGDTDGSWPVRPYPGGTR